jgi:uncharacterized membrane protein YtjA (UPF0391 family)
MSQAFRDMEPWPGLRRWFVEREAAAISGRPLTRSVAMLKWALIFFLVAIVAGALGFTNIAAGAATIAKVLFGIFIVIFLIFLVLGLMAGEALL